MYILTASIVAYKNKENILRKAIESFLDTKLDVRLYLVDNSPSDKLKSLCQDESIEYIFNNKNLGFGKAHNIAIKKAVDISKYHLVLNPDVYFQQGVLEELVSFMDTHTNTGLIVPKVCNPDGTLQYICKLLPSPSDFILRRLKPEKIKALFKKRLQVYDLSFTGYNSIINVSYLTGCFMFLRTKALKRAGYFDTRFFLHFEDADLTRRIHKYYKTLYYPDISIFHSERGPDSLSNKRHLMISAVKYFNKWGWFFDKERKAINRKVLKDIITNNQETSLPAGRQ